MCWRNEWPNDTEQPPQPFPTSLILWSLLKTFLDFARVLLLKQYPKGEPLPQMLAPCGVLWSIQIPWYWPRQGSSQDTSQVGVWGCLTPGQKLLPRRPHQQLVMIPLSFSQETWGSLSLRPACTSGCYQKTPFYITYTLGGSGDRTFAFQKLSKWTVFRRPCTIDYS